MRKAGQPVKSLEYQCLSGERPVGATCFSTRGESAARLIAGDTLAILFPSLLFLHGLSDAGVAQLVEHLICNQRVGGSIPSASSTMSWAGE